MSQTLFQQYVEYEPPRTRQNHHGYFYVCFKNIYINVMRFTYVRSVVLPPLKLSLTMYASESNGSRCLIDSSKSSSKSSFTNRLVTSCCGFSNTCVTYLAQLRPLSITATSSQNTSDNMHFMSDNHDCKVFTFF